jgi:hypothetical protein
MTTREREALEARPSTIVMTHYRYKPPPRKRKTAPLAGPAVVRPKRKPTERKKLEPASRPVIATTTNRKQMRLDRVSRRGEDRPEDPEAAAAMRAWLEKAKWGRGLAG